MRRRDHCLAVARSEREGARRRPVRAVRPEERSCDRQHQRQTEQARTWSTLLCLSWVRYLIDCPFCCLCVSVAAALSIRRTCWRSRTVPAINVACSIFGSNAADRFYRFSQRQSQVKLVSVVRNAMLLPKFALVSLTSTSIALCRPSVTTAKGGQKDKVALDKVG
jgi:hypothetical protein